MIGPSLPKLVMASLPAFQGWNALWILLSARSLAAAVCLLFGCCLVIVLVQLYSGSLGLLQYWFAA